MHQRILLFYNNYIKHYLFPQVEEADDGYQNPGQRRLHLAGQLIQNKTLPLDTRLQGVYDLGLLAYTGGYGVATSAVEYLPTMVDLLQATDTSDDQRITVLQSLSLMCYVHLRNQRQAHNLNLYNILQDLMEPSSPLSPRAKQWSCYLLNTLCYNNVPAIRTLVESQRLRRSLEVLEGEAWLGWPKNHAQELLFILSFWPVQTIHIHQE